MATIHLIDAEKGDVGKSVVARTLYPLFLDRHIEVDEACLLWVVPTEQRKFVP